MKTKKEKALQGTLKPSRDIKTEINLPKLNNIDIPKGLYDDYATSIWMQVTSLLNEQNRLCESYFNILLIYCNECAIYFDCVEKMKDEGMYYTSGETGYKQAQPWIRIKNDAAKQIKDIGSLFGLDPLSSLKLPIQAKQDKDPLKDMLG